MKNNWILGVVAVLFISATAVWHLYSEKVGMACFMFYLAGIDTAATVQLYQLGKKSAELEEGWKKLLAELEGRDVDSLRAQEIRSEDVHPDQE